MTCINGRKSGAGEDRAELAITMDNLWSVTQFLDLRLFSNIESHV